MLFAKLHVIFKEVEFEITYWIVLKRRHICLNRSFHITSGYQSSGQVYVAVNKVRLQSYGMSEKINSVKLFVLAEPIYNNATLQFMNRLVLVCTK